MNHALLDTLKRLGRCRIAVVGDLMLDRYLWGQATRISQEAPVPVVLVKRESHVPGGAANVARNVLSLGGRVSVYGCLGEDEEGRRLSSLLAEAGAETEGVVAIPGGHTTVKTRVLAGNQQVVRVDRENPAEVTAEARERLLAALERDLASGKVDALVMEDYAKWGLSWGFMAQLAELARRHQVMSTLDPHPTHPYDVQGLTLMTPNRMEAFALAELPYLPGIGDPLHDTALARVGRTLLQRWGSELMLITLGAEGMALFRAGAPEPLVIPTRARQVFDVSGAGDTVMATMTLAICAGASHALAASLANYAAGIVVGYVGTRAIDARELEQALKEQR